MSSQHAKIAMPEQLDIQLLHCPAFEETFTNLTGSAGSKKAIAALNDKRFTVKAGDVSYRLINHWTEEKLLGDDREEDSKGWRKLSMVDVLWLRILRELRAFGVPLETLRKTRKTLFFFNNKPSPALEVAFGMALKKMPVFVVVFKDGEADIAMLECVEFTETLSGQMHPFIRIPINSLIDEILGREDGLKPEYSSKVEVDESELDALENLRSGEYHSVNMLSKGGKISRVETRRKVDGAERIIDLLKETGFGEVTVKVENGKAVHTEVTKKEKK